jgi:hypothetical protein
MSKIDFFALGQAKRGFATTGRHWISGGRGGGNIEDIPINCFGTTSYFLVIADIKNEAKSLWLCPQAQFFSPKNTKTYLSRQKKGTFGGLPGVALSRGQDIPGHSRKKQFRTQFLSRHSIIPPPCWLCYWLSCWLLCCCHVVIFVFVYFVAALPTLPPPPPLAHRRRRHRGWSVRRMRPATRTSTAALPHWRKLSAWHWNPVRCWTGPSRPVARAAKAAMMMVAPTVAAKVKSHTGSLLSSPPPPEAVGRRQGWRASEGRGNKEGNCNGNKGGEQ